MCPSSLNKLSLTRRVFSALNHTDYTHTTRNMIKVALVLALVAASTALPRLKLGRGAPHRIVGGADAERNEFPYTVSVQYLGSHLCGGSIIRSNYIVTAAQCAEIGPANSFTIKAGKHNLGETENTEQVRQVDSLTIHPSYQTPTEFSNDIAVMKTTEAFMFNSAVSPIPMAPANHTAMGPASITGWGTTEEEGEYPEVLQKVTVDIVTDAVCREAFGGSTIEDNMICAGSPGADSCTGDSGGPLTAMDRGYRYLAGVTSFGFGCARPGYPGVYTEIAQHTDFIQESTIIS